MANTYTLLETITVGAAGAASVTFNSIPQTGYTDLVIKVSARGDSSTSTKYTIYGKFNGSATSYSGKYLEGNGASAASGAMPTTGFGAGNFDNATFTANTFGNSEIYIPNYTSANYKSVSVDATTENNATTSYADFYAGLWSNTAAITSVTLTPEAGNFVQYSTFSLYGVSALGTTPTKAPKATGGSIIQTDGTYWYHAFLSSGTFTPATALSCDVLVVAGGGGGGISYGAGAGAGGVFHATSQSLSSAQTVTIGAGGAKGSGSPTFTLGSNGSNSTVGALTAALGGGGGANDQTRTGVNGGSGGGGGQPNGAGGSSTQTSTGGTGYGFAGGSNGSNSNASSGGGGAGSAGLAPVSTFGGAGGAGTSAFSSWGSVTGTGTNVGGTYYFAGGGSGNGTGGGATPGNGGTAVLTSGTANTGSGAGGDGAVSQGGSGIVIIRYLA
jgi:hypothetical protein